MMVCFSIGFRFLALLLVFLIGGLPASSVAKTVKTRHKAKVSQPARPLPSQPRLDAEGSVTSPGGLRFGAQSVLLMDALSKDVLYEKNPNLRISPASFVKIMTLYLAYDALRDGELKLDETVTISERAWRMQGSKMFVKVGDRVRVEELLKGIAIASGNDACVALSEHMAGSEDAFVAKMNEKANFLGLKDTKFMNSHGMPAEGQQTTALDMATLARRYLEDYPDALRLHSTPEYEYNGIRQGNRNILLQKNIGVDGLKTGHVEESGYHLLATAKRDGRRMIAVVMGCQSVRQRAEEAQALLEYGFKNFSTVEAARKGAPFGTVKVRRGKAKEVAVLAAEDVWVAVARGKEKSVSVVPQLPPSVTAPVRKGQVLAKLEVQNAGKLIKEIVLVSSADIEKSLLPPWPVVVAVLLALAILTFIGLWWIRRTKPRKF